MAEVRRRPARAVAKPVSRRRDRVADVEEDEEEDTDATPRVRSRRVARPVAKKRSTAPVDDDDEEEDDEDEEEVAPRRRPAGKRRPAPVEDDEDLEEEDEEDDEEEEEEEPAPRRKATAKKRRIVDEDEDDEDEDEPPTARRKKKTGKALGVASGLDGVESIRASGGSGVVRLKLGGEPTLIKVLGPEEPFASYRQHWVPQGGRNGDRPYTCIGKNAGCPLCDLGDNAGQQICFNVLDLNNSEGPSVRLLQVGITAFQAFKTQATPRGKDKPLFDRGIWAVSKSGKGQQSQTNFRPVKIRDLEEDWPEVLENFDPADLDAIIEEAMDERYDMSIIQTSTKRQLQEVAKYLTTDDDDDD